MANELNERGIRTHHGAKFNALTVNRILAERQYTGYLITKDVTSPFLPELQIITQELFNEAQVIVEQRKRKNADWRNIPRQNSTGALLGGNLYCATCGSRMTSSNPGKAQNANMQSIYAIWEPTTVSNAADKERMWQNVLNGWSFK